MDAFIMFLILGVLVAAPLLWSYCHHTQYHAMGGEVLGCRAFLLINMVFLLFMVGLEMGSGGGGVVFLLGWNLSRFVLNVTSLLSVVLAILSAYLLCRESSYLAVLAGLWSALLVVSAVLTCYEMNHLFIAHWGLLLLQLSYCMVVAVVSLRYAILLYQHHLQAIEDRQESYFSVGKPSY